MRTVAKPGIGPWLPAPSPPPEPWGPGAVHPEGTCTSQPLPGTDRVCPCLDCRGAPTSVTVASGERAGGTGRGSCCPAPSALLGLLPTGRNYLQSNSVLSE